MIKALKNLMWKSSSQMLTQKMLHFHQEFSVHTDFMAHFTQKYLIDDKFMHWSAAYQLQMFINMETNNYIESWHNQLKTNYLQRKRNRRLDHLIFVLVKDVYIDFMHNTARMTANIGRMSTETRKARKRMIAAEEINELSLQDMVQKVYIEEEVCYIVKSFMTEVAYDISTEQGMMTACNCIDFQRNKRACKHMYLTYRFDKNCVVYSQGRLSRQ
ncbi:hypothetical protein BCV71DRAFT_274923 [Rhizopus microsporus]|uniref:SWIM-type domain-containing protein n=1 Tax=Rhizopus microsporus TaxID=58291 RepID=A0A1X0RSG2_RHIZD|nr:hypothetical protein BCV71DRAFT_274923 [Rhizopus microsporus]